MIRGRKRPTRKQSCCSRKVSITNAVFLTSLMQPNRTIISIPSTRGLEERIDDTRRAMPSGADIIYQEALLNAPWHGYADFLLRVEAPSALGAYSYEVIDTRLARHTRPKHVVQLCVYSELLAREQGSLSNITCSFGTCLN